MRALVLLLLIANSIGAAEPPSRVSRLISPNGKSLAFKSESLSAQGEAHIAIIVCDLDGRNRRSLPIKSEKFGEVLWLDDVRLAYEVPAGFQVITQQGDPLEMLALPETCDPLYQVLSPDATRIAFIGKIGAKPDDQYGLFVADVAGGSVRRLLDTAVKTAPAWSADGRFLAIGNAAGYVAKYPLVTVDVQTGELRDCGVEGVGAAWSPDGSLIAVTTGVVRGGSWWRGIPHDGHIGLWSIEAGSVQPVSLPALSVNESDKATGLRRWEYAGCISPVWSPDSQWVAYTRRHSINGSNPTRDEMYESVWIARRDGSTIRKVINQSAQLAFTPDSQKLIWVHDDEVSAWDVHDIALDEPTPARPHSDFSVFGSVTDAQGNPMQGVKVRVATGMGTLIGGAEGQTDAQGRYVIHFGPGIHGAQVQYAIVSVRKEGFYEQQLCAQGNLGMAYRNPGNWDGGVQGMVYPKHPRQVDFVLLPAAKVTVRLVDPNGQPIADRDVWISGQTYPASSVLASLKTDAHGEALYDQTPLLPYRFDIREGRGDITSDSINFTLVGPYEIQLTYDKPASKLEAKVVSKPR